MVNTKEAWNYNNLIIGALNTKPKDEQNNLECQKTTPRLGKTQRKPSLGVVHFWPQKHPGKVKLKSYAGAPCLSHVWPKHGSNVTEPHGHSHARPNRGLNMA
ncbi:hypothetical protein PIB30_100897 [Stylosanthes scabra]|uniref:Uncharacterized protein n=1 Tax=Stylosanthes scabra TaxID=79078 RepID=A0ABU6WX82_9FABA|nr:hypothetical protein [Stylosanthes scabra]